MNKTIISFAKKYNMQYTELNFMYGLTGYRFDFDLNDYNTMSWCKSIAVFFALLCYIWLLTAFNCFMVHFTAYGYKTIFRKLYAINQKD